MLRCPKERTGPRAGLKIHRPAARPPQAGTRWLINGFAATVLVWSEEEFRRLAPSPPDAQLGPDGRWVAIRIA